MIRELPREVMIDGIACRGARTMLGLSQSELSDLAGCGRKLLNDFENDIRVPSAEKRNDIRRALEDTGAQFFIVNDLVAVAIKPGRASVRSVRAKAFS
jgi:transcriptional regulator with XRE-family HTH domain